VKDKLTKEQIKQKTLTVDKVAAIKELDVKKQKSAKDGKEIKK
jgi:hypothetical protein